MKDTGPREYIYYSDRKIDELAQQMPRRPKWIRKIASIRQIGAQVAGTGGSIGLGEPERDLMLQTLQSVWKWLDAEHEIGTFDEPKKYFYGRLAFYSGDFATVDPPVLFMAGATDRTIVALGGQLKHARSHRGRDIPVEENAQKVSLEPDVAAVIYASEFGSPAPPGPGTGGAGGGDMWATWVANILLAWQLSDASKVEFEVLARQEGRSTSSLEIPGLPSVVLIGSPVFVALT